MHHGAPAIFLRTLYWKVWIIFFITFLNKTRQLYQVHTGLRRARDVRPSFQDCFSLMVFHLAVVFNHFSYQTISLPRVHQITNPTIPEGISICLSKYCLVESHFICCDTPHKLFYGYSALWSIQDHWGISDIMNLDLGMPWHSVDYTYYILHLCKFHKIGRQIN